MDKIHKIFSLFLSVSFGVGLWNAPASFAGGVFELSPAVVDFSSAGSGTSQSFIIKSIGDEPVAVQLDVLQRKMSLDGIETNPDGNDDFVIYPPQILIPPGSQQVVRVTWLGEPNPSSELAYRLVAEQLPINLSTITSVDESTGSVAKVTVTLRYFSSVYISPTTVSTKVVLENIAPQKAEDETNQLVVTLDNQGTVRKILEETKLTITSEGKTVTLTGEQLKGLEGENILAGNKRQFILPWPEELPVGPVTATFTTN